MRHPRLWRTDRRTLSAACLSAAAFVALLSGCDSDPTGGVPVDPVDTTFTGRYELVSVEGADLPAAVFEGEVSIGEETFLLRIVAVEGYLEVEAGRWSGQLVHESFDGEQLIGRESSLDRGEIAAEGTGFRFRSEVIENLNFRIERESPDRLRTARDAVGEGRIATYRYRKDPE